MDGRAPPLKLNLKYIVINRIDWCACHFVNAMNQLYRLVRFRYARNHLFPYDSTAVAALNIRSDSASEYSFIVNYLNWPGDLTNRLFSPTRFFRSSSIYRCLPSGENNFQINILN
jgi:hypothetical protein